LPVILRSRWMLLKCIFEAARRLRRVGGGGSR
jgi:hypothetical protein